MIGKRIKDPNKDRDFIGRSISSRWIFHERMNSTTFNKMSKFFKKKGFIKSARLVRQYGAESFSQFLRFTTNKILTLILRSCIYEGIVFRHIHYTSNNNIVYIYLLVNHVDQMETPLIIYRDKLQNFNSKKFEFNKFKYVLSFNVKVYLGSTLKAHYIRPIMILGDIARDFIDMLNDDVKFNNINMK